MIYYTEEELVERTNNAFEELTRYGGRVWSIEFVELLEKLADINGDFCHGRVSEESINEVKELIDTMAYKRKYL